PEELCDGEEWVLSRTVGDEENLDSEEIRCDEAPQEDPGPLPRGCVCRGRTVARRRHRRLHVLSCAAAYDRRHAVTAPTVRPGGLVVVCDLTGMSTLTRLAHGTAQIGDAGIGYGRMTAQAG